LLSVLSAKFVCKKINYSQPNLTCTT